MLANTPAESVIADRDYHADEKIVKPLQMQGKKIVIPSKKNRKKAREYNRELYKARHLIENFFCSRNSTVQLQPVMIKWLATSLGLSTSQPQWFGLIDYRP